MTPELLRPILIPQLMALESGSEYRTPDNQRSRRFTLRERSAESITVQTEGGARIPLPVEAFIRTVIHLHRSNATEDTPIRIGSSNQFPDGLCRVARGQNGRTRVINYVLPILERLSWVQINGHDRPNTAWLHVSISRFSATA